MATRRRSSRNRLDNLNPANWTSTELKDELEKIGIKISANLSNNQLRRIYLDNKDSVSGVGSTDNSNEQSQQNVTETTVTMENEGNDSRENVSHDLSSRNLKNSGLSNLQNSGNDSRINFDQIPAHVDCTFPPNLGGSSAHFVRASNQNNNNMLDYTLLNSTLAMCQQALATNKPKEKYTLHSAINSSPAPFTQPIFQAPTMPSADFRMPLYSAANQQRFGYPASAFSVVDLVSPDLRSQIISDGQIPLTGPWGRENSNSMPKFGPDYLDLAVDKLKNFAIADSTKALYSIGMEQYLKFMQMQVLVGTSVLPPVSESLLMRFVAFCDTQKHLKCATIKSYLCGIRFFYLQRSGCNPLENIFGKPLINLKTVLVGLKKKQAQLDTPKRVRLPITFDILYKMCMLLRTGVFNYFIDILIETACIVAFFGFLRCGEFTTSYHIDTKTVVSVNDVQVANNCVLITLKKSKTDPFRCGITIPLFQNNSAICPFQSVQKYLEVKNSIFSNSEFFFITNSGVPLSRTVFISHIKYILDKLQLKSGKYNGHSFRSGAATSAHKARLEDHLIQTLGRRSSDCYTRYLHTSPDILRQAQAQIVATL